MASARVFEILSLILIVGLAVSVEPPFRISGKLAANEERTLEALRAIAGAQERHRNATGRFGFGHELLAANDRGPYLDRPSRSLSDAIFSLEGTGYLFRIALPAEDSRAVFSDLEKADATQSSVVFAALAWPEVFARTGKRVFWMHYDGRIVQTENLGVPYEGTERPPAWDAALRDASLGLHGDPVADGVHAMDAKIWELLEPVPEDEDHEPGKSTSIDTGRNDDRNTPVGAAGDSTGPGGE